MKPIFIDFETRSLLDLREYGTDRYCHNPSTEILSIAWSDMGLTNLYIPPFGPSELDFPGVKVHRELPHFPDNRLYIAHNGLAFDSLIMSRFFGDKPYWFDTMLAAKVAGKPGGLAKLGTKEDDSALRILTSPKNGRFIPGNPVIWRKMLEYNIQDIVTLEKVYTEYRDYYEPELIQKHQEINLRGIPINREWTHNLVIAYEAYKDEIREEIEKHTKINLNSADQVKKLLEQNGFHVESIQQKYLKEFLLNPDAYRITPYDHGKEVFSDEETLFQVLEQRREISRNLSGKLSRVLIMEREGRVRHCINYYGAHTGRFSGKGLQPHNFARPIDQSKYPGYDPVKLVKSQRLITDLKKQSLASGLRIGDMVSALQRTIVQAKPGNTLLIGDYSSIEAVGTAWICGEEKMLEVFRKGGDIYQDFANRIGCSRQLAKIIILGCGYGMSGKTFKVFCYYSGIDLESIGLDAIKLVEQFRETYSRIKAFWSRINRLALTTVQTGRNTREGDKLELFMERGTFCIRLPSGRVMYYPGAIIMDVLTNWGTLQPTIHYHHHHGGIRKLYGGLLTENIVQGMCRDILADGLLASPVPICLHVHDEEVSEVSKRQAKRLLNPFIESMKASANTWAKGFPINVKGYISPIYGIKD